MAQTEYDVVKKAARKVCNFRTKYFLEDQDGAIIRGEGNQKLSEVYDVTWHDLAITPDFLSKLHPW